MRRIGHQHPAMSKRRSGIHRNLRAKVAIADNPINRTLWISVIINELCGLGPSCCEAGDNNPGRGRGGRVWSRSERPLFATSQSMRRIGARARRKNGSITAHGRRVWHKQDIRTVAALVKSRFLALRAGAMSLFDMMAGTRPTGATNSRERFSEWRPRMRFRLVPAVDAETPIAPKPESRRFATALAPRDDQGRRFRGHGGDRFGGVSV